MKRVMEGLVQLNHRLNRPNLTVYYTTHPLHLQYARHLRNQEERRALISHLISQGSHIDLQK